MIFALKWVFHIHSQASQIFFFKAYGSQIVSATWDRHIPYPLDRHTAVSCVIMYVFIYTYFKYLYLPIYL